MPVAPGLTFPPPGLAITALDIIKSALRKINVLASGATPSAAESQDALYILNRMIDGWQSRSLMIFSYSRQVFNLVPGQQTYTMGQVASSGITADFNAPRPARITGMGIISLNNPAQPLELPMDVLTTDQWAQIPVKNIQSTLPLACYPDYQFPFMNFNFWQVPSTQVQVAIYSWAALTYFNDLSATKYSFPPGYVEAIDFNLTVRLAAEYAILDVSPYLTEMAINSLATVEASNGQILDLRCDTALVNPRSVQYDWRSDTPAGPK